MHGRTEDLGKDKKYREKFDYVTSRAVANLSVLSEYMLPLVKIGGKCICMKGSNVEEEVEESKKAINILGGKIEKDRYFLFSRYRYWKKYSFNKKQKGTPNKYPRKGYSSKRTNKVKCENIEK